MALTDARGNPIGADLPVSARLIAQGRLTEIRMIVTPDVAKRWFDDAGRIANSMQQLILVLAAALIRSGTALPSSEDDKVFELRDPVSFTADELMEAATLAPNLGRTAIDGHVVVFDQRHGRPAAKEASDGGADGDGEAERGSGGQAGVSDGDAGRDDAAGS